MKISLKTHQKGLSLLCVVACAVSDVKGEMIAAVYLKIFSWGGCFVTFVMCILQALQPHQLGLMVVKGRNSVTDFVQSTSLMGMMC